ncbi:uncharacterized protein LOC130521551 [Takifugu flavidus]|uniref:uncharacterized protein LOC130521551 n=1 Tax=Takifugu flavidus TaxID=433684 RepID=UPI0025443E79|nr:uncharacterized protein LOC130521551 [Takifugu flavidus]
MELRRHGNWIISVLLIWGNVLPVLVGIYGGYTFGLDDPNTIVQNLDCTNDLIDTISCDVKAPNCSLYRLRFLEENKDINCSQGTAGRCNCSLDTIDLIYGATHTVIVWKGNESLGSTHMDISASIKPRVPTVVSIGNSKGVIEIKWKSNMEDHLVDNYLKANVTYFKKGETTKLFRFETPAIEHGLKVSQLPSQDLEPSSTYVVCVRSYSDLSGRYSDCSAEKDFTTPMSDATLALIIITSLSIASVLISSVAFLCFVKLKDLWWDKIAKCPKPKLLLISPTEQMVKDLHPRILKPVPPIFSLVHVEPLVTDDSKLWLLESVITTGDHPSPFTSISPISTLFTDRLSNSSSCSSPSNLHVRADDNAFRSCGFENKSYSIVLPTIPQQQEGSEVQTQGQLLCDPVYHGADGDSVICDGQQLPAHLLLTSASLPLVDTDMSYQVHKADFDVFPQVGISACSSVSSIDNASEKFILCDETGICSGGPSGSNSPLPVDFSYQTFQSLVEPSDDLTLEKCSTDLSGHPDKLLTATTESISHTVVSCCTDNARCGAASPTFQTPFLSLLSADQSTPMIIDSGYQSVEATHVW